MSALVKTKTVRVEVVVPVDVTVSADDALPEGTEPVTAAMVALALRQLVIDYNDGRYAFSAEMLHEGAGRLAMSAAHRALMLVLNARFGDERVPDAKWGRAFVEQRAVEEATPTLGNARVVEDGCTARPAVPCAGCGGSGDVPEPSDGPGYTKSCPACRGTGCAP